MINAVAGPESARLAYAPAAPAILANSTKACLPNSTESVTAGKDSLKSTTANPLTAANSARCRVDQPLRLLDPAEPAA
jgi:hypothetical protein